MGHDPVRGRQVTPHLRLASPAARALRGRERKLFVDAAELHVVLNDASEEYRTALANRDKDLLLASCRRLLSLGVLFGDLARRHGAEL